MAFTPLSRKEFDSLFSTGRPHRLALLNLAAKRVGWTWAEDCVQDGLLHAWQCIDRYNPEEGPSALLHFLARFVHHACRRHLRSLTRRNETLLEPDDILRLVEIGHPPDITSHVYAAFKDALYATLERVSLTRMQEQCIRLWLEGLTQAQTADYLMISQQAVSAHIIAGGRRLRNAYEWSEEIPQDIWRFFWEMHDEQCLAVYRRPSGIWDREGHQEERTSRARRFALSDEAERRAEAERLDGRAAA